MRRDAQKHRLFSAIMAGFPGKSGDRIPDCVAVDRLLVFLVYACSINLRNSLLSGLTLRCAGVGRPLGVGLTLGVGVTPGVEVGVGVNADVAVAVGVDVDVAVGVGVALGLDVIVGVAVGVTLAVALDVGVAVGVPVGVARTRSQMCRQSGSVQSPESRN